MLGTFDHLNKRLTTQTEPIGISVHLLFQEPRREDNHSKANTHRAAPHVGGSAFEVELFHHANILKNAKTRLKARRMVTPAPSGAPAGFKSDETMEGAFSSSFPFHLFKMS